MSQDIADFSRLGILHIMHIMKDLFLSLRVTREV